jgi:dihydrofolate reductase
MTGKAPTPAEVEWARFAARTPHYVLSSSLSVAAWPNTHFLRNVEDVAALKAQEGKDIYLVGGGRTTAGLIDAGLVDELRLMIYPVIAGDGRPLFSSPAVARGVTFPDVRQLPDGRVALTCAFA